MLLPAKKPQLCKTIRENFGFNSWTKLLKSGLDNHIKTYRVGHPRDPGRWDKFTEHTVRAHAVNTMLDIAREIERATEGEGLPEA